jgi:hypothetical protein
MIPFTHCKIGTVLVEKVTQATGIFAIFCQYNPYFDKENLLGQL